MASDTSLVFNILARDRASKTLKKIEGGLGKLSTAITGLAVGAGVGLAKVGGDFDDAFDSIAVGSGATGDALEGLKADFKAALADTPAEMGLVADAMTNLNGATGATGETLQGLTTQVVEASRLLGEDGAANAEAFGKAMRQWQLPAEDGAEMLDKLFAATQEYGGGLDDVIGHLNTYGPVLQNAGFTMEESAALFANLSASGISVSRVMPGINSAFRKWAGEGKNLQGELAGTVDAIANAETSTEALAIATDVFGAEGAQRLTTAIRNGALELDGLSTALDGAEGLIGDTADSTDSWQEKLGKLKNEGLVAVEPLASALFDRLSSGVDILKSVVEWGKRNTDVVKALGIALGGIAATIVAVNTGLKIYRGVQMAIRAATVAWTAVQWLLNAAMTANPIGLIVVAIGALIAIIVLIATKTTWFQDLWDTVWSAIKTAALAVGRWFRDTFWKKWIKGAFDGIKAGITAVKDWFVNTWDSIIGFFRDIPGKISRVARGMWDGIKHAFRSAINWIIDAWNRLEFRTGQVNTPFGQIGPFTVGTPDIPRLAEGGIVTRPTLAMVGERGPEAVIPLRRQERVVERMPDEFTATATIDLGEGVRRVIDLTFERRNRATVRAVRRGAEMAR